MEYDIVSGNTLTAFKERVIDRLIEGWKLQGGVCVTYMDALSDYIYFQAMFKE